jgi:hypothetical protein
MTVIIRDPLWNNIRVDGYALRLVDTRVFQRLRYVRAGAVPYFTMALSIRGVTLAAALRRWAGRSIRSRAIVQALRRRRAYPSPRLEIRPAP